MNAAQQQVENTITSMQNSRIKFEVPNIRIDNKLYECGDNTKYIKVNDKYSIGNDVFDKSECKKIEYEEIKSNNNADINTQIKNKIEEIKITIQKLKDRAKRDDMTKSYIRYHMKNNIGCIPQHDVSIWGIDKEMKCEPEDVKTMQKHIDELMQQL